MCEPFFLIGGGRVFSFFGIYTFPFKEEEEDPNSLYQELGRYRDILYLIYEAVINQGVTLHFATSRLIGRLRESEAPGKIADQQLPHSADI